MSILKQAQIVKLASQVAHETDTAHNADNLIHKIRKNTSVNHPTIRSKACRGRSRRRNSLVVNFERYKVNIIKLPRLAKVFR